MTTNTNVSDSIGYRLVKKLNFTYLFEKNNSSYYGFKKTREVKTKFLFFFERIKLEEYNEVILGINFTEKNLSYISVYDDNYVDMIAEQFPDDKIRRCVL